MKKFEYKESLNCNIRDLNNFGKQGWELINIYKIHPENNNSFYLFKKEVVDEK